MITRAEEIAAEGPYVHYQSATGLCWLVRMGTVGYVYEYQTEFDAINGAEALNAAYKQGQQDRLIPVEEQPQLNEEEIIREVWKFVQLYVMGNDRKFDVTCAVKQTIDTLRDRGLLSPPKEQQDQDRIDELTGLVQELEPILFAVQEVLPCARPDKALGSKWDREVCGVIDQVTAIRKKLEALGFESKNPQ